MRFKRAFSVLIDNFATTYKLLLYKLIVVALAIGAVFAALYPVISNLLDTEWTNLIQSISFFIEEFFNGNMSELSEISAEVRNNLEAFVNHIVTMRGNIIWGVILVIVIYALHNFLTGLGDYAAAAIINDKMTLQANSPFINTFIKSFANACKYNALFVPLSVLYDILALAVSYLLFFIILNNVLPIIIKLFFVVAVIIFSVAVKKSFTVNWLPAMIAGKIGCLEAFKYSFNLSAKRFWTFVSDFSVINVVIVAITVSATVCTLGVAAVLCVPAATLFLLSFSFVCYFDDNDYKYFTDANTIVKPKKEHKLTREEFFKGEQ